MLNASILSNLIGDFKNLIFPQKCIFCEKPTIGSFICNSCLSEIAYNGPRCIKCAKPVNQNTVVCLNCTQEVYYKKGFVLWSYNNEKVAKLIKLSKFHGHFYYLNVVKHFKENIDFSVFDGVEALVAVPMHKKDLQKRGYNQSLILAKVLSKLSHIDVCYNLLEKVKLTKPQVGLKKEERQSNLKDAFLVHRHSGFKKVLIVDDVITTASTINECAKALLKAGIESNFFALAAEY